MRLLVAFDKFKDALAARQACELAARAVRANHPDWELDLCPLTDGGEGFADILTHAAGGQLVSFPVTGPRGGLVEAPVGLVSLSRIPAAARARLDLGHIPADSKVALIEMASASGLALLPRDQRDPWQASSRGTGQLIRAAAELGAAAVILGIGGSATHDLGLGALSALGLEFRGAGGRKLIPPVPALWPEMERIEGEAFPSIPPLRIACDVTNPLLGPRGAAAVYASQKGLKPGDYGRLEAGTARVAELLCEHCGRDRSLMEASGAGAAGGFSFGLIVAAGAHLLPGFDLVTDWLDLDARVAAADAVLTGEGRFDRSSLEGKGPGAVASRALALGKAVHVFAGQVAEQGAPPAGLSLHAITPPGTPLAEALKACGANLAASVRQAV